MEWTDILILNRAKRVTINGREFLVAPITLIVPGVLNGSKGPLLYQPDDTRQSTPKWNGMPIVLEHPYDPVSGEHLSANSPGVIERQGMGFLNESRFHNKLQTNGYFDAQRTQQLVPQVYQALLDGSPVEVSTGLYTRNEDAPPNANYKGRPYSYIARDYRPDHLAVLVSAPGACSVRDGCGLNVNKVKTIVEKAAQQWHNFTPARTAS